MKPTLDITSLGFNKMDIKLNLGSAAYCLEGFKNYDLSPTLEQQLKGKYDFTGNWDWRKGFPDHKNNSVDAVTCSCTIYNFKVEEYPQIFSEVFRILKHKGIFRIVEENNNLPEEVKKEYNIPWLGENVPSATCFKDVKEGLNKAGFKFVGMMTKETTNWKDNSLIQDWHSDVNKYFKGMKFGLEKYFHLEAIKI
jgi:predicted SAM-dependent methyltransferase